MQLTLRVYAGSLLNCRAVQKRDMMREGLCDPDHRARFLGSETSTMCKSDNRLNWQVRGYAGSLLTCRAGKKRDMMREGLWNFSFGATSRVMRK